MVQERHEARFVPKEYTQNLGIDYQEIFALVAKMNSIRIILSLVVNLDWSFHQFVVIFFFFFMGIWIKKDTLTF